MNFKLFKSRFVDKKVVFFLIISILLFIISFLILKSNLLYDSANYIDSYISYYTNEYLGGDFSKLIVNNSFMIFIENEVMKLVSAPYIYCLISQQNIYMIYVLILPLLLFYLIFEKLYDEIHNGMVRIKVLKIGLKKYIFSTLVYNCLFAGIISVIPKIIYYTFLCMFYSGNYSQSHVLTNIIDYDLLNVFLNYNPIHLVIMDFIGSFMLGVFVALLTMMVVLICQKKVNTYFGFIFSLLTITIIATIVNNYSKKLIIAPLLLWSSVFKVLMTSFGLNVSLLYLLLSTLIITLLLGIIAYIIFRKRIVKYL